MARAPQKSAETPPVQPEVSAPETSAAEGPRFVRLVGIAARSGGRLLAVGKMLEVGVDIPLALAEARLADQTAEAVLPATITGQALRDALKAGAAKARSVVDAFLAAAEAAGPGELLDLVEGFRPDHGIEAEIEAVQAALRAHRAAFDPDPE